MGDLVTGQAGMDRSYQPSQPAAAAANAYSQYGAYYGNMEYHLNSHGQINPQVGVHLNSHGQINPQVGVHLNSHGQINPQVGVPPQLSRPDQPAGRCTTSTLTARSTRR